MGQARLYDIVAGIALCEGLEVIVEEDYVIVSQSITVAKDIESMIRRSKV
jgi:myo-inositol-1(or 4)-monophosphatase